MLTRIRRAQILLVFSLASALTVGGIGNLPAATAAPQTVNLPTLDITLNDPDSTRNTLDFVHASKDNKVPTTMTLEDPSGAHSISAPVAGEIKGRGNYTWTLPKKPYQIKFADNTAVLGMSPSKTWILLANAADASLMRNKAAFDLANSIGLAYSPESKWVDLRVNGKYLGNYLISEKTEVKKNRVDLSSAEGVLVELDNNYGLAEPYNFRTGTSKSLFVLKDAKSGVPDLDEGPLPASTKAGWDDITTTLNTVDALLAAPQIDWAALSALIDVDSFVKYYYVFEQTANPEITQSSIYFYKDGLGSKLFAGPVWDFDSALGNYDRAPHLGSDPKADYAKNAQILRQQGNGFFFDLFRSEKFVERANQLWQEAIGQQVALMPSKITTWENEIKDSAAQNFAAWPILGTSTLLIPGLGKNYHRTYAGEVAYLRDWVTKRATLMLKEQAPTPVLRYRAHVQDIGWQDKVNFGQVAGTLLQSKRTESLSLETPGSTAIQSIEANAHVQDIGWMGWRNASNIGTTGRSLRVEGIQLRLTGALASDYDISYRTHVQDIGWQSWVTNGATAGTSGQAKRIEAIQVRLLAKTIPALPAPTPAVPVGEASYSVHSADVGWSPTVFDGTTAGVLGKRVESLKFRTSSPDASGNISYRAHVQDIGWMSNQDSSAPFIGTTGRGLRMEAFEITLTGDLGAKFNVEYRANVKGVGWQDWAANGRTAGTTGKGLAIEQVEIRLVPKA
ncbi:MAG: CotH kinase family protein [Mycetocola sp.]